MAKIKDVDDGYRYNLYLSRSSMAKLQQLARELAVQEQTTANVSRLVRVAVDNMLRDFDRL